jgi:hypothetical protein
MTDIQILNSDNSVYIKVDGYLSNKDIKLFTNDYKQKIKGIKTSRYNLIIEAGMFECEKISEIKNICMMFYKTGYKKIYLIDPNNYIMSNIRLSSLEKKIFLSAVKIVNSKADIH